MKAAQVLDDFMHLVGALFGGLMVVLGPRQGDALITISGLFFVVHAVTHLAERMRRGGSRKAAYASLVLLAVWAAMAVSVLMLFPFGPLVAVPLGAAVAVVALVTARGILRDLARPRQNT